MTRYQGLVDVVTQTIVTAVDDGAASLSAIHFDIDLLSRVFRQATSPDRLNAAIATCDEQMRHWIFVGAESKEELHLSHARAALALKEKLIAPPRPGYVSNGTGGFEPCG